MNRGNTRLGVDGGLTLIPDRFIFRNTEKAKGGHAVRRPVDGV